MEAIVQRLGTFTHDLTLDQIPAQVVETAKAKVLDVLACAYAGEDYVVSRIGRRVAGSAPSGPCTLLVGGGTADEATATFVNAAAAHAILQDDLDLQSGHPGAAVIPAALAVAESSRATGADLLAAVVAGYDVAWRVGGKGVIKVRAQERGFRSNTMLGTFGAAAAASRLAGRGADEIAKAIAIAASLMSGLLEPVNAGTMERTFQHASNARQGVLAAWLAQPEMVACPSILEGERGIFRTIGGFDGVVAEGTDQYGTVVGDPADGLGTEFRIVEAWAKPFPSAGSHTVALALTDALVRRATIDPSTITRARYRVLPRFTGIPGYPAISSTGPIETIEAALVSFPYEVACYLRYGTVDLARLEQGMTDPEVDRLMKAVELVPTEVPHPLWAELTVTTPSGEHVITTDELDWSPFFPDTEEAGRKLDAALSRRAPGAAEEVVALVRELDKRDGALADLNAVLRRLSS